MPKIFKSKWVRGLAATLVVLALALTFLPAQLTITGEGMLGITLEAAHAQEPEIGEIIEARDRTSKTYYLGDNQYALDITLGSLHYKDNPSDPDELWKDIETTITASPKENWDWEVVKGNWHLLIRSDTTVAVGKDGHWIGFRYEGFGYLDWATKEYVILDTRGNVTPTVDVNSITWEGIFYGVNLEYIYTADGFKENLYITQTARDWLVSHPPSSYGLDNASSYLVGYLETDWQNAYPAEDVNGNPINWDSINEFIDSGVYWRHPVKDYLVSALPLDYARHDEIELEGWAELRYRFYKHTNEKHYLLFGAKVLDLNDYPAGTINLDPTLDLQVGANLDDVYEKESNGLILNGYNLIQVAASTSSINRRWGGWRWTSGSLPSLGDTIDVAYVELKCISGSYNDMKANFHFEKAASPGQFTTTAYDVTGRTRTTASVSWIQDNLTSGIWHQSPSLVTPLQEVIDNYSPTALVVVARPAQDAAKSIYTGEYEAGAGAKLHIEWTGGCSPSISLNTYSWSVNGGSPVAESSNYATGLTYFTITNNSGGAVTITIGGTDMTGGGYTWDLADDGSPGDMIYGLYAGLDGGAYTIVVKESAPYNTLKAGLADSGTQDFGLKIYTPTNFDDGNSKSGTITLTVACD